MNKKTCLITGGNSGIGKQAAIQLAKKGFHIIIGVRSIERGQKALTEIISQSNSKNVELLKIDLSSKKSIIEAAKNLRILTECLDVLIHNAADFDITQKEIKLSEDGVESIWATNHIGPIILTNSVLDLIKKSKQGRIITIASKGLIMYPRLSVNLNDPEFKQRKFNVPNAYYQSKLAQIMYTYWLANFLKETKITVNCIRVTNVKIDINRYPNISRFMKFAYSLKSYFSISPEEMAKTYTYVATSPELSLTTGKYFNEKNKLVSSSKYSTNTENISDLMQLSKTYTQ